MPIVPRYPTPGRMPRAASAPQPELELMAVVDTEVTDSAIRLSSEPSGVPFSSGELNLDPPLFCELVELITHWDRIRERWSVCTTASGSVSRFAPGSSVAEQRRLSDPDLSEWVRRARAIELVSCYDEFFGDWEVSAVLVSGFDETAGVWVLGPGELSCLLTRRAVFVSLAFDEPSCLLAARCLSGGFSDLDRPRLARLEGVLVGPTSVRDLQRVAEEFSSLRALSFQL